MSDREIGKKEEERTYLAWFADAYEYATGLSLGEEVALERPDFICRRGDGRWVGVEVTAVRLSPAQRFVVRALRREELGVDAHEAMAEAHYAATRKAGQRRKPDWELPDATILVLIFMDTDPDEFEFLFDGADLWDDFAGLGFLEVWIANATTVEPYGAAALFGLFPSAVWGAAPRLRYSEKPYG